MQFCQKWCAIWFNEKKIAQNLQSFFILGIDFVFSVDKNGNRKIRGGLDLIRNGSESYLSAIVDAKILEKAEERNRRIKVEQGKQMSFS